MKRLLSVRYPLRLDNYQFHYRYYYKLIQEFTERGSIISTKPRQKQTEPLPTSPKITLAILGEASHTKILSSCSTPRHSAVYCFSP